MTSEIDKLKHFHVEDYSGIYFTDELNAGEEFLCLVKNYGRNILKLFINIELIQVK